jgi:hypothetical protein
MLTRKPAQTESLPTKTKTRAPQFDVLPPGSPPAPSPAGALVTREQFASTPVPEGFDTANLSTINKG